MFIYPSEELEFIRIERTLLEILATMTFIKINLKRNFLCVNACSEQTKTKENKNEFEM